MSLSRPMWGNQYAGVFIRIPLGIYFITAGVLTIDNLDGFVQSVRRFSMLPDHLATLYGVTLPYFEIFAGLLLLLGIWTALAAIITSIILGTFIYTYGLFPHADNPYLINKDLILFGACLSLLATGAGAFSVDSFRTSA